MGAGERELLLNRYRVLLGKMKKGLDIDSGDGYTAW